jgi:hypothetical protein
MDSMLGLALLRRHVTGIPNGLLILRLAFELGQFFERIALRLGPGHQGEAYFQRAGELWSDLEVNGAKCRRGSGDENFDKHADLSLTSQVVRFYSHVICPLSCTKFSESPGAKRLHAGRWAKARPVFSGFVREENARGKVGNLLLVFHFSTA